jgi:DeoR/GlpR family transcriptional regulator of sugar metabolism
MKKISNSSERQKQILELLSRKGNLSVLEIAEQFSISEATARRDLNTLADEGKIQRFFGGALLTLRAKPEEPILRRTHDQEEEKERIGRAAADQVQDGETIFLGSGTTVVQVAKNLKGKKLTVITNSLPVINLMSDYEGINLITLGGEFRASERSFIGHITEQSLQELRADKVIIGIHAISLEQGLTNDFMQETLTDRAILRLGMKVIIAADHTKFERISTVFVAPVEKVNMIITDRELDDEYVQLLELKGVKVLTV